MWYFSQVRWKETQRACCFYFLPKHACLLDLLILVYKRYKSSVSHFPLHLMAALQKKAPFLPFSPSAIVLLSRTVLMRFHCKFLVIITISETRKSGLVSKRISDFYLVLELLCVGGYYSGITVKDYF